MKRTTTHPNARLAAPPRTRRMRWGLGLLWVLVALLVGLPATSGELALELPPGVLPPEIPEDNPLTTEKVELGKKLFFDARLSADGSISCATCHNPATGFVDQRGSRTSAGVGGKLGTRNSPTVLNAAMLLEQFWDGRAPTLEAQAVLPFINPIEMAIPDHPALEAKIAGFAEYPPLFAKAFGDERVTVDRVGKALASFERTLITLRAPIDRYLAGDEDAISASARRGWVLFNGKARCNTCHGWIESVPTFTDDLYHNIGVGVQNVPDFAALAQRAAKASRSMEEIEKLALQDIEASELGRFLVTREVRDIGAFKTSPLRNIAKTAPYFHDGSASTLLEVVEHYDRGGVANPYLDGGMRPLGLTDDEKRDLVALMESFTSDDIARFEALAELMR